MRHFLRGLDTASSTAAVPYGFTVAIWSCGALLIDAHGTPSAGDVFLFVLGGVVAYGVLQTLTVAASPGRSEHQIGQSLHWMRAGAVHTAAVGAAVGAAALLAPRVETDAAWALAPFAVVVLYLGVSSVEVALLDAEESRRRSS